MVRVKNTFSFFILCCALILLNSTFLSAQYPSESPSPSEFGDSILVTDDSDWPNSNISPEPEASEAPEPSEEPSDEPEISPPIPVPDPLPDAPSPDPSSTPEEEYEKCMDNMKREGNQHDDCFEKADGDKEAEFDCLKDYERAQLECICKDPDNINIYPLEIPYDPSKKDWTEVCLGGECETDYQNCMTELEYEKKKCYHRAEKKGDVEAEKEICDEDYKIHKEGVENPPGVFPPGVIIPGCELERDECKEKLLMA